MTDDVRPSRALPHDATPRPAPERQAVQPETALYAPVKRFLEGLGFAVKGEIGGCDVLALSGDDPVRVVVGELKTAFTLDLVLQGIDRAAVADEVWLAAPLSRSGRGREADPRFRNLCRRLGFGLLGVAGDGRVDILVAADAALPRRDKRRRSRLVEEHRRRAGDPMAGGGTRRPVMTAYRQQALGCAAAMADGPRRPRDLKAEFPKAASILADNVYGWFKREARGLYGLTELGRNALHHHRSDPTAPAPVPTGEGREAVDDGEG